MTNTIHVRTNGFEVHPVERLQLGIAASLQLRTMIEEFKIGKNHIVDIFHKLFSMISFRKQLSITVYI